MSTLGLSCPSGGKFYICDKAVTRFIGCCTIDPCGNGMGDCPTEHLKPSSFSSDSYANIPAQNCAAPSGNKTWYTCSGAQPPFMGCCASTNPCQAGKCPQQNLLPARLSDIDADAQIFLDIAHGTQGQASSGPPLGAIIGAAVGGAVLVALIVGFVAYRCGWFARRRREEKSTKNSSDEATKLYDATGDGGLGGLAALHSGTHPSRDWPEHEHIRSNAGSPAPQYSSHSPGFAPYSPGELYNKRYSDGPVEPDTTRENKNRMSPASTASPFPVSPGFPPTQPTSRAYLSHRVSSQSYAPLRESSQTYGNVSELGGSYDPSAYQTSPPHSRRTSELNSYLPNSSPYPSPRTHHDHEYTAMELDASQHSRAAPISELPGHHY